VRRLKRQLRLIGGYAKDSASQKWFLARHPPRAPLWDRSQTLEQRIPDAIERGSSYLLNQQSMDGSVRGFLLVPGASTSWLTAHVSLVTEHVPYLDAFRERAADFLEHCGPDDGGWGYNRRVGVDIDSSVQAHMVLLNQERSVPTFVYEWILASQHAEGGFPTYAPLGPGGSAEHGWQQPHLDVSIVVCEWLRRYNLAPSRRSLLVDWIHSQTANASVPSYWWNGQQYGLWALARASLLDERFTSAITDPLDLSHEAPDLPMALTAALSVGANRGLVAAKLDHLLSLQLDDGSWPCARCLRVTDSKVHSPDSDTGGRRYADKRRVFSTAHAIAALQVVQSDIHRPLLIDE